MVRRKIARETRFLSPPETFVETLQSKFGKMALFFLLFLMTLASYASPVVTAVVGKPESRQKLTAAALDNETVRVSAKLRCPVCQGLSIADSPATMAVQMKQQVRELLASGYSEKQIIEYFEKSYGQFVRLDPPRRGINWMVWLAPVAVFFVGILLVRRAVRRRAPIVGRESETALDAELVPFIERVREIAYGTKEER